MSKPTNPIKLLTVWLNAASAAWNMGEAPWLFDADGRNVLLIEWNWALDKSGGDAMAATKTVALLARKNGVDPKRHKWHGRG